ncbi:MAG: pyridoxal-dependent decarboxylase [Balneolaceae bacterium]
MSNYSKYLPALREALVKLDDWRSSFGKVPDERFGPGLVETSRLLDQFRLELQGCYPFHHPSYAGQMLKPPHPAAWAASALAMTVNPNNHALDGGPATAAMERESIRQIASMAGFGKQAIGHLTAGGSMANLEALWVAREERPDKMIAFSGDAHYTHARLCRLLQVETFRVPETDRDEPDFDAFEQVAGRVGTLVVTMGTTGTGRVEPLHRWLELAGRYGFRIHADAAYGGFFKLIAGEGGIDPLPWESLGEADSVVIDPHKHGLQPYGCGSVIFRDPAVGRHFSHDSPYTYFTSEELHPGELTLECSRSGAAAAALWFTLQLIPLTREGLGERLLASRRAALALADGIDRSEHFQLFCTPELDIVTWFPRPQIMTTRSVSELSKRILQNGMRDRKQPLYLSLFSMDANRFSNMHPDVESDSSEVALLRSVLMKPEHELFVEELLNRLNDLYDRSAAG